MKIYHNPRCSKSRQTLALLQQHGHNPEEIRYMESGVAVPELKKLIAALGFDSARQLMRTKETQYRDMGLKDETDEDVLLKAMSEHPRLMERPILLTDKGAALGRPPENVLTIL